MLITSIIFSKDRPAQLDLCLKSIKQNFKDSSKNIVLYNNTTDFTEAHKILQSEHEDVSFWPQGVSLFKDLYAVIASANNNYICFFTDDDIVYQPVKTIDYNLILQNDHIACLSLRMGLNISERSHDGVVGKDIPVAYREYDDIILWSKTANTYGSYWSYSLSVDGHIFRINDIHQMIDELCILESRYKWKQTPNELEGALQRFWTTSPNTMVSFKHSAVVNSPNNRVQESHLNRSGDEYSAVSHFLLGKYLAGQRINLDYLNFNDIKCPHTEINILEGLNDI